VTSGQLAALGLPVAAMNLDASKLIDTYGKTWHFWQVDLGHELPMGECVSQSVRQTDRLAGRQQSIQSASDMVKWRTRMRRRRAANPASLLGCLGLHPPRQASYHTPHSVTSLYCLLQAPRS
jgi:hypothetical protein